MDGQSVFQKCSEIYFWKVFIFKFEKVFYVLCCIYSYWLYHFLYVLFLLNIILLVFSCFLSLLLFINDFYWTSQALFVIKWYTEKYLSILFYHNDIRLFSFFSAKRLIGHKCENAFLWQEERFNILLLCHFV